MVLVLQVPGPPLRSTHVTTAHERNGMSKGMGLRCRAHIRAAFTLVELLVVIGIIVLLLAMLMPVLADMRIQSRAVVCSSNLRQLGLALTTYAAENRGRFPPNTTAPKPQQSWCDPDRLGR